MSAKRLLFFLLFSISYLNHQIALAYTLKNPLLFLVTVTINEVDQEGFYRCYLDNNGELWMSTTDLMALGFPNNPNEPVQFKDKSYFSLNRYQGLQYHLNQSELRLNLHLPLTWITPADVTQAQDLNQDLRPTEPGAFFNYDVSGQHIDLGKNALVSGITEIGAFNHFGFGTSSFLLNAPNYFMQEIDTVRLETRWTLDQPENMASWRFGDAITSGLNWSGASRFAGIQKATNFATQPTFITFPQPGFKGEAAIPSAVDVFVNDSLAYQKQINPGPFYVNQIPVITGAGTVQVVTTDMLGRQSAVTFPYYASPILLKRGLTDYSFEAGFLRCNYGLQSNDYGRAMAVGTYSLGLRDWHTAGIHGEILSNQQTLGINNNLLLGNWATLNLGAAASRSEQGAGVLGSVGLRRQTLTVSYGFQATVATPDYIQIGTLDKYNYPNFTLQSFLGVSLTDSTSLAVTFTQLNNAWNTAKYGPYQFLSPDANVLLVSYSQSLFKNVYLNVGSLVDIKNNYNRQIFATITMPLDADKSMNINTLHEKGFHQENIQVMKNLPLGNGYGYRFLASNNGQPKFYGELSAQQNYGLFGLKYANFENTNNYELDARGSVISFAQRIFAARHVDQSFALVHIPDMENVDVYYRNQVIGQTNKRGYLYIPEVLAYQPNEIHIEPQQIPLNTTIAKTSEVIVPYHRSGVLVHFDVHKTHHVLLTLSQETGQSVPAGASVIFENQPQTPYPVGYDGQVFVESNETVIKGRAIWADNSCSFSVAMDSSDKIINREQVVCY